MTVEYRLLGPVETWVDGYPLNLGYAQQRCVFAVLLADLNKAIPAGELVTRVWGDEPPRSAYTALYAHIARLRRVLAGATGTRLARRAGAYLVITGKGGKVVTVPLAPRTARDRPSGRRAVRGASLPDT